MEIQPMTINAMLDIETMGTRPGCVILSIGCVAFNDAGHVQTDMYKRLRVGPQLMRGAHVDEGTQKWWQKQSFGAKRDAVTDPVDVPHMYLELTGLLSDVDGHIWAQGASFDFPILAAALRMYDLDPPWEFWAERDTRTAYSMAKILGFDRAKFDDKREGGHHNALDDCYHQIKCLVAAQHAAKDAARFE